ncbi:hypothetical protein SAMN02746065_12016 [Desulfocicer vacuolatum DSM 3385]|uniref:RND family efflux transporter, MFP subunit n=1 Tax=Desulfocicer vacuolatum DSM 3385 TaxID=1121400 RepID=A0A1W2DRY3_9BACT|nr:hypothetical protein [Desulfocicer vacuolatum]SMD00285.1 hypothetical protein SAMN02746065_12016 [Desulfocicer vacuolatum DSM 3385]
MKIGAILKKIVIIVPIIVGVILFVQIKKNKEAPIRLESKERVRTVRVIPLKKTKFLPRAVAYGYVEPSQTWEAICEVSGKVVEMHKDLKKGFFINKGQVLLRIDTATYGLAESRGKADVMSIDAQLKELEQSRKNTRRLLDIEKRSLNISVQELKRKRGLFEKGYLSESDVESEEKRFLAQQTTVNNLQNSLNLFPAQRRDLLARKDAGELTVTERQLDVAKTEIIAPFDCRLSQVNVELNQYASTGSLMLKAESIHSAEIPVQISPRTFMTLLPRMARPFTPGELDMESIRKAIGITAMVRFPSNTQKISWQGHFSRTSESMDPTTGALTIYVTVDDPYKNIIPGKRPPLLTNMYVEVELRGRMIPDQLVVPATAVHEGRIYIAGTDNRLKIKKVEVAWVAGDLAVLSSNDFSDDSENDLNSIHPMITPGETLVISDLVPAIEGMLLNPIQDKETARRIQTTAAGHALFNSLSQPEKEQPPTNSGKEG